MRVEVLRVGQLATNCYLVESGGEVGIIDPGDDGEYIIHKVGEVGGKPVWIAATHGHFDHVLAVTELALAFQIPFYLHPKDKFLLKRSKETAEHFTGVVADPSPIRFTPLSGGMALQLGEEGLGVIETPGHTPGSVSFYDAGEGMVFSGDLVFSGGVAGRTDLSYSSEEDLRKSVSKLMELPKGVVVYPGHGEKTTIGELKRFFE